VAREWDLLVGRVVEWGGKWGLLLEDGWSKSVMKTELFSLTSGLRAGSDEETCADILSVPRLEDMGGLSQKSWSMSGWMPRSRHRRHSHVRVVYMRGIAVHAEFTILVVSSAYFGLRLSHLSEGPALAFPQSCVSALMMYVC